MKYLKTFFLCVVLSFWFFSNLSLGEQWSWWSYWTDPVDIVDNVKQSAWTTDTKLDQTWWSGSWIKWTLSFIRDNVWPYIDWWVFIWLSLWILLIIYNALFLVVWPLKDWNVNNVKTRIVYISIWIIILTWFYFIIKIILSLTKSVVW